LITIQWLPLKFIGGLLLLKITWDLLKTAPQECPLDEPERKEPPKGFSPCITSTPGEKMVSSSAEKHPNILDNRGFWKAVSTIVLADVSMSLDNVLAVGGAANGNVGLIAFGIALNLPLLFFGSQYVAELMNRFRVIIYIGAGVLMQTALSMILEERLLTPYIPHLVAVIVPWVIAIIVLVHGYLITRRKPEPEIKRKPKQQTEQVHVLRR
jgi:YjbE family integral membrane protein